ncbi:MAG: hypothetical protein ACFE0P_15190 [Oceanicaulis sp.]
MRRFVVLPALLLALAFNPSALAEEFASLRQPAIGPVAVGVVEIGPELTEKAEEYGPRELNRLTRQIEGALMDALMDAGRFSEIDQPGANILLVVIEDAQPNRPTFRQLSMRPNLSARSLSLGGARVTAILTDPAGEELGRFAYSWRTPSIDQSQYATVWADADTAFDRFARLIARELREQQAETAETAG